MQQLRVLMLISGADGMTPQQLGRQLGVSQATVSGIVDRLVAHDFVTRQEDPHDRRIRHLWLAPEGSKVLHEIMQRGNELQRRVLEQLDDETLRMTEIVLQRLSAAVAELSNPGKLSSEGC
jgi:DNA-binding MarR family transcriptional regulator